MKNKPKKSVRERTLLKFFAGLLAVILLTLIFFSGVLTVVCLHNNVYLDGGVSYLRSATCERASRLTGVIRYRIDRDSAQFNIYSSGYNFFAHNRQLFSELEQDDCNFIFTFTDQNGGTVFTTGKSPAAHTFGYLCVYSGSANIYTVDRSAKTEMLKSFDDAPSADEYINQNALSLGLAGTLKISAVGDQVIHIWKSPSELVTLTPSEAEPYDYLVAEEYSRTADGDISQLYTLSSVSDGGGVDYSDYMGSYITAKRGSVITADYVFPFSGSDSDGSPAMYADSPSEICFELRTSDGTNAGTLKLDMVNRTFSLNRTTYSLDSAQASSLLEEVEKNYFTPLQANVFSSVKSAGVQVVEDIYFEGEGFDSGYREYDINSYLDLTPDVRDSLGIAVNAVKMISAYSLVYPAAAGISALLFLLISVYLCCAAGHSRGREGAALGIFDRIPQELIIFGLVQLVYLCVQSYKFFVYSDFFTYILEQRLLTVAKNVLWVVLAAALAVFAMTTLAARIKCRAVLRYTFIGITVAAVRKCSGFAGFITKNLRFTYKILIIGAAAFIVDLIALLAFGSRIGAAVALITVVIAAAAAVIWSTGFTKIAKYAEKIAGGEVGSAIDKKYLFGDLKRTAENLEGVSEGVKLAVDERMRSERLKTELITNVSHDLKTPLTSIVNYVDILSKDDIEDGNAKEHIAVLKRQADRMKKLIEDLVEVSKASSGNVSVTLERTDVNLLLTQCCAEYSDRFEQCGLEPVIRIPEQKTVSSLDGRLMWRVLDNLLSNICKYALSGTRVYISAEDFGDGALLTFKNISRFPLDISGEDLMERFVRGDSSRNTEGSGLGLSIAKSLCDLQGVDFRIITDGDLFKAELRVKKCGDGDILSDEPADTEYEEKPEEAVENE